MPVSRGSGVCGRLPASFERGPTIWGGAEGFCRTREREKVESTAQKKRTESSVPGHMGVGSTLERWSPAGQIPNMSFAAGITRAVLAVAHRAPPRSRCRGGGGGAGATQETVPGVEPQTSCSPAKTSGRRSSSFMHPSAQALPLRGVVAVGTGSPANVTCHDCLLGMPPGVFGLWRLCHENKPVWKSERCWHDRIWVGLSPVGGSAGFAARWVVRISIRTSSERKGPWNSGLN